MQKCARSGCGHLQVAHPSACDRDIGQCVIVGCECWEFTPRGG